MSENKQRQKLYVNDLTFRINNESEFLSIHDETGQEAIRVYGPFGVVENEAVKLARLIASQPDLLEVVKMVVDMYDAESYINCTHYEQFLCDKANAAIAKAKVNHALADEHL